MNVLCPKCRAEITLSASKCDCGHQIRQKDGIYVLDAGGEARGVAYVNYDPMAAHYHHTRGADNPIHAQTADFIYQTYLEPGSVVLDLGAGTGIIGFHLARHGLSYIAADASLRMLSVFKRQADEAGLENVTFVVMNALNVPFPDNSIDAVTARAVFHHIEDYQKVISEVHRILKPRGKLLLIYTDAKPFEPDYIAEVWDKYSELVGKSGGEICDSLGPRRKGLLEHIASIGGSITPPERVFSDTVKRDLTSTLDIIKNRDHPCMRKISDDLNKAVLAELDAFFTQKYGEDYASLATRKEVSQGVTVIRFD